MNLPSTLLLAHTSLLFYRPAHTTGQKIVAIDVRIYFLFDKIKTTEIFMPFLAIFLSQKSSHPLAHRT